MNEQCPICSGQEYDRVSYSKENIENPLNLKFVDICKSCDLGLAEPRVTQKNLDKFYREGSYWDSQTSNNKFAVSHQKVQSFFRIENIKKYLTAYPQTILDVGAGNGHIGEFINVHYPEATYFFYEPDEELSNSILKNVKNSKALYPTDELSESFDVIFINHVLEHVEDPVEFLETYLKFLKPNGVIYIETPNQDFKFKNTPFPHTLFFNKASMEKLIKKVGLKIECLDSFGARTFVDTSTAFPKTLPRLFAMSVRLGIWKAQLAINNLMYQYQTPTNGIWLRVIARK